MKVVVDKHEGQSQERLVVSQELPEHSITPPFSRVKPESSGEVFNTGHHENALTPDAKRRL